MLTLVLRRGHVDRQTSMATAEYRRGHGTHIFRFDKALVACFFGTVSVTPAGDRLVSGNSRTEVSVRLGRLL